jgi:nickel-dependent lactate racemase
MPTINLKYGNSEIPFDYEENQFAILGTAATNPALTDVEIGERFDNPIDSKTLEEIVKPNETVLIVVPDATRQTASGQIVNLLVRRLIAGGTMPFEISIIFATGIHRRVTEDEKRELLTPFIAQRIKTLDHNPRDLAQLINLGETGSGTSIRLNRALAEHDHVVIVGGVTFHYFAGFTGGRKLICPGLAASQTISETHRLAFDCDIRSRRVGVATGILDGNAVHESFMEIAGKMKPAFSVNTIVNEKGEATEMFCGDWIAAHRKACEFYAFGHTIEITEKRDTVIASCGGSPHDINLIQAHKALDMAARACADKGAIVLLAECADGFGRNDFADWFEVEDSEQLAGKLCEKYQVNGQTAWNLLRIAERFNVRIITLLGENETRLMRLRKTHNLEESLVKFNLKKKGYILPFGAKFLIKESSKSV